MSHKSNISISIIATYALVVTLYAVVASQKCYGDNRTPNKNVLYIPHFFQTNTQSSSIKTIRIYKTGWELAEPIIELNSNESITLTFDDLSEFGANYSYRIIHCAWDWTPSDIHYSDFMEGFQENTIPNYSSSMGTTIPYNHYTLTIPNNDVKLKVSGNYKLQIFDTYTPEVTLFEREFMVVEPIASIFANITRPGTGRQITKEQQVNLKVSTNTLRIDDPFSDIRVTVKPLAIPAYEKRGLLPLFVRGTELDYTHPDSLIFEAGNEFRSFNNKNIRTYAPGTASITYRAGEFYTILKSEGSRQTADYSFQSDINGKYAVDCDGVSNPATEADYSRVLFQLPYYDELPGKTVHVYGELTNWQTNQQSQMQYNKGLGRYELELQLKQGYYNFIFVVKDNATGKVDATFFEGSHFATENRYLITIYYMPMGSRYHRLVGVRNVGRD